MENEIKKLISKYDMYIVEEENIGTKARISEEIYRDLDSLLKLYQSKKEIPTVHDTIYAIGEK